MSNLIIKPHAKRLVEKIELIDTAEKITDCAVKRLSTTCVESLTAELLTREDLPTSVRPTVLDNYLEELGEKAEEIPHEETRRRVVEALGGSYEPVFLHEFETESTACLLGRFLFTEYQVTSEYAALLKKIRHFYLELDDEVLFHLIHHIEHDPVHFRVLKLAIDAAPELDMVALQAGIDLMYKQRLKILEHMNFS